MSDRARRSNGWWAGSRFAWLALASLLMVSCQQTERARYRREIADTGEPALHGVHDERLREIMKDLNSMTYSTLPQEMEPAFLRRTDLREIARVAKAMSETAGHIPDVIDKIGLPENDRGLFLKLAADLGHQANELERLANANDTPGTERAFERVTSTCTACHKLFRSP